jgi:hypothetical protein
MKSFRHLALCSTLVFVLVRLTPSALATSFVVPSDTELIRKADAIVRGLVVSRRVVESDDRFIETVYEIAVARSLKGHVEEGTSITVRSPGGTVNGRFLLVESAAHFIEKEDVLLFLTSENGQWTPTDMTLGKFRPALTSKGFSVLVRDDEDIAGWSRDGRPHIEKVRLEANFVRFIEDTVRGQANDDPYDVDAAEVITPAPASRRGGWQVSASTGFPAATYSAQFVAGDESRPGRWPTSVMNAGVPWFKNAENDLTGAEDGGVGAIRAGLSAWTGDSGSSINLIYAGSRAELARPDSENLFVFNDPQGWIAGEWTGSGVIATAYLYGAGSHTFGGHPFLNIVGSDIVFQNGYTAGEPSLEEAMTHEIGHTLGLRHSNQQLVAGRGSVTACNSEVEECSISSIMNPRLIDTLGFALQGWDMNAAKALYPALDAIPLPPTNVIAIASTGTNVFVSWSGSDGATSYTVWRTDGDVYTNLGPPSPPAATSFLDETATANRGYFYQVEAHNASGSSGLSGADIAITVIYTDNPLSAGMPIKAVHLSELRTAANLMRALTGSVIVPTYTDPTIVIGSTTAKAAHFQEVESVLIGARMSLGLSVPSTLGIAAGGVIPAAHINALRSYTQ